MKINKNGFTLIELLLYISLTAIMLLGLVMFLSILLQARIKNQTIAEVEQQGMQVMQAITKSIEEAQSINTPTQGANGSSLSLQMPIISNNPTVFSLVDDTIQMTQGVSPIINLTNSRLITTSLNFNNVSRTDIPGIIKIEFNLEHINPEGRNEYKFNKTFYSSTNLSY